MALFIHKSFLLRSAGFLCIAGLITHMIALGWGGKVHKRLTTYTPGDNSRLLYVVFAFSRSQEGYHLVIAGIKLRLWLFQNRDKGYRKGTPLPGSFQNLANRLPPRVCVT
jgi:hypothetical protein